MIELGLIGAGESLSIYTFRRYATTLGCSISGLWRIRCPDPGTGRPLGRCLL